MTLLDEMFVLVSDDGRRSLLRLNPVHPIFAVHFPGHPITPGVCLVQLLGELLQRRLGCRLQLSKVVNLKFVSPITPEATPLIAVTFTSVDQEEQPVGDHSLSHAVHAKGTITIGDSPESVATKFSVIFR